MKEKNKLIFISKMYSVYSYLLYRYTSDSLVFDRRTRENKEIRKELNADIDAKQPMLMQQYVLFKNINILTHHLA